MAGIDISSGKTILSTGLLQLESGVAMSTTLTSVTDQSNNASQLKLATNATQVVGTLQITTNNGTYLDVEDGSGNNRWTISRDPASQIVNMDFASNPTGLTQMVGGIRTYSDGVNLGTIMSFRKDGNVGIGTSSPNFRSQITTPYGQVDNIYSPYWHLYLNSPYTSAGMKLGVNGSNVGSIIQATQSDGTIPYQLHLQPFGNNLFIANNSVFNSSGQLTIGNGTTPLNTAQLNIKGSGSTSATTSLLVQNSGGTAALTVRDDQTLQIGSGPVTLANTANLSGRLTITRGTANDICLNIITQGSGGVTFQGTQYQNYSAVEAFVFQQNGGSFGIGSSSIPTELCELERTYGSATSTNNTSLLIKPSVTKTGGTNSVNFVEIRPILNASGGNTTTRGLYYNPTLTNISNITHYAIQTTSGGAYINTATPNASAALQADSTTQGFLPPRMTDAQVRAIASPAVGLMAYNTDLDCPVFYSSAGWRKISHSAM